MARRRISGVAWVLAGTLAAAGTALVRAETGAAPEVRPAAGEIRLDGEVAEARPEQHTFLLNARAFMLPNGRVSRSGRPRPKTVAVSDRTVLRSGGNARA